MMRKFRNTIERIERIDIVGAVSAKDVLNTIERIERFLLNERPTNSARVWEYNRKN